MNAALIVGISDYPPPISKLPAVAADVREIGNLLRSKSGTFTHQVEVLTEQQARRTEVLDQLRRVLGGAEKADTIFVYMAGHGTVVGTDYYFVTYDTDPKNPTSTAVPLAEIKRLFDGCESDRLLLWLDFCHSGGIIPRQFIEPTSGSEAIRRTLEIVRGQGRMIFAACTPEQSAYEDPKLGHGVFTAYLLEGLRGAAAQKGEVTANSLFDFIDRKMGTNHQRPMQFGEMIGRLVLVQHESRQTSPQQAAQSSSTTTGNATVMDSTGNWCLLGNSIFEAASVQRSPEGNFVVDIPSQDSETDAAMAAMVPGRYGTPQTIAFAHRSDGLLVRIVSVESRSTGTEQVWTVAVKPSQDAQGGFGSEMSFSTGGKLLTPDEQAKLRAGRLLLNNPPPLKEDRRDSFEVNEAFVESFIQGFGGPISAKECVVQSVYNQMRQTDDSFLRAVRLAAVFMLKATNVCEHILELKVGPVSTGRCHVRFRGRRASMYTNQKPFEFQLKGDCPLE